MSDLALIYDKTTQTTSSFSSDSLAHSLNNACLAVGLSDGVIQDAVTRVCHSVSQWLLQKDEVTSDDVRRQAAAALSVVSAEAGYIYENENAMI
jgi:transcriptional regulator NrdR family protein